VNTIVLCTLSAIGGAALIYWWQERRRQASIDPANELQTRLSVTESLLADINGRFNSQGDDLRQARDSLGELSNANARLDALAKQAEKSVADLNNEKSALNEELRQERERRGAFESDSRLAQGRAEDLGKELTLARQQLTDMDTERKASSDQIAKLTGDTKGLERECTGLREQLAAQKQWIEEQTEQFERKVLAAATTMMEERGKAFTESNRKEVDAVIAPFKEQLAEFRTRVDHIYSSDTRERGELRQQIEYLTNLNQTVSNQAERLTNALTVTSKSTGDWGEMILQRILEDSGLREGKEYRLQHSITDSDGDRVQPDAVIFLPENRQLVIDSKVSNKAWTEFCHETGEEARKARLKEHLASLRAHVKGLAAKDYSRSPELQSVDFVVMFVPVEAALLTAFAEDESLYTDAFRSKIILVTPSTLMAVVKMVEGLWTLQKRKESADEIAEAGRRLYEKLVNFATTFVEIGEAIKRTQGTFEKAQGQLSKERGAIRLAQRMVELGVSPAAGKSMPLTLIGNAVDEYEDVETPPQGVDETRGSQS
jgi:DNA recombination protein RmuC